MTDSEEKDLNQGTTAQENSPVQAQPQEEIVSQEAEQTTETISNVEADAVAPTDNADAEANALEPNEEPKEQVAPVVYSSKAEIIDRLKEISASDEDPNKTEIDRLKAQFYKLHLAQRQEEGLDLAQNAPEGQSVELPVDLEEEEFKAQMSIVHEKLKLAREKLETERKDNLAKKQAIIDRIKAMATSPDEVGRCYQEFKSLQQQWREIKSVPAEAATELWRNYQHCVEQFYDLLKLNHEAREYDFRKNLEIKTKLCEAAERLADDEDVVSAFQQLQELHNQYRETGPVAKEQRDEIWARFKAASTVINKRHQQHFETLRQEEGTNLERKTELCEQVEKLVETECKTINEWEEVTKQIIALQQQWKTIGFAPQKMNVKIFERFRSTCDKFFTAKSNFYKEQRQTYSTNAELKRALIEKAKALQDSTDWKATADKLIELQKEWKQIGYVPKKVGDKLWAEFLQACNTFFDARKAATSGSREQEQANLKLKRDIIERIAKLGDEPTDDASEQIKQLADEYAAVGHVPFRNKEEIYKLYRETMDAACKKLGISSRRRSDGSRGSNNAAQHRQDEGQTGERGRLLRRFEQLRQEVLTYENNLGFLSSKSNRANALVDEIQRKIQKLKDEIQQTRDHIKEIDAQSE